MSQEKGSSKGIKLFSKNDMAVLEKSDHEQKRLREFANTHDRFSEEEKHALQLDSVDAFSRIWVNTLDAKGDFQVSHEHGVGATAQILQSSADTAVVILQHIEPILQLVKDFGAPYGGMAVGTISFLFTIARNRAKMESDISDTLSQIHDRVAGLRLYRHIYNDDHELDHQLQSNIVKAYDKFIDFCIVAIKYYSEGSIRRWAKALWGSSVTLENSAHEVQQAIVNVRYMSEELLNKNVGALKEQLVCLKKDIKRLREGQNSDRLVSIKELLHLEGFSMESESEQLRRYQYEFNVDLERGWDYLEHMRGSRLEEFKSHLDFQAWRDSSHSCMLLLTGYNDQSVHSARRCWLSSIALDTIENFRKSERGDPYAFYILEYQEHSLLPVLSHVIIQLLTLNPQALENDKQYEELRAEVKKYCTALEAESQSHNEHEHSDAVNILLQRVALRVLNMFDQTKPVWIIMDRVDNCKLGKVNHRKKLMKALVYLLENAAVKVKVLVVANGYDWKADKESDEFGQSRPESIIVHTAQQKVIN
ncbi:hypothetical protein F5Y00DRAFT_257384 [Daldinia vernicosa]|uniref:uncharacterized protein n=1 Tax=Daldinia vernicosa TaxID=114800 RepID=UPI002007AB66|nr:uncharacterized protein F5Y00DRAFT_257384 [Daldinia vernicosa]KAI0853359.1 hypothetical protein F5Y00DRAFT_257384 [Daldinia vernicosa]